MKLTHGVIIAALLLQISIYFIEQASADSGITDEHEAKHEERYNYDIKKQRKYREKFCQNQELVNQNKPYTRLCREFNKNYLKIFFSVFVFIGAGAFIRTILRIFDLNFPYTVLLMVLGILIGLGTRNENLCTKWSMYTTLARAAPEIILYVFLPMLIFESAFAMKAHVFVRSVIAITILALPGMIFTTFLTAWLCQTFFYSYNWTFMDSSLYGSIISATDPVAVVAILKEIGTSEMLTITVEGESLLNDGVAILLYEVFKDLVLPNAHTTAAEVFVTFVRIALGGPAFGWLMARISIFSLSRIFNDPPVEVSITLAAAYLTYYIGEAFLHVSGVMAVVVCGIVMSAERTCISPEVQGFLHHFWEMLGYLGNTVLFVLVGIVITETAINNVTAEDGYYLIFLYFALNISRFLMIVLLSPILSHVGYGLSWQNMLVMSWGGLRGAVGICLSLEVFRSRELCERTSIGPKFLLQTAGIVMLTLLINGTTTKTLLKMLKLSELSIGKMQDMGNAVRQIQAAQQRCIGAMKHDRLMADCNFEMVEAYTALENPYTKHKDKPVSEQEKDIEIAPSLLIDGPHENFLIETDGDVLREANVEEYREMTEEARLRLLKAMKVSCWRQYEQGILTEDSVQILVEYMENCEDEHLKMFHSKDLKKYWQIRGVIAWMRNKLLPFTLGQIEEFDHPPDPEHHRCQQRSYEIVTNYWFDAIIHIVILLNMIPVIWETVKIVRGSPFTYKQILGFLISNVVFTLIYIMEFALKMIGFGCGGYFSTKWNIMDALILLISIVEMCFSISYISKATEEADYASAEAGTEFLKFLRFIRILRMVRVLRLFRPLLPKFMDYLNTKVNKVLFYGYDIAKGSATAIDDILKFLPQMIDNQKVLKRFKSVLEEQRLILLLEMGLLQKDHPGIAIAVKTRHANRAVLNTMRDALKELKEDGLLDEKEYEILLHEIESKMKNLWNIPAYMAPRLPEMLLADLQWVSGNTELLGYLIKQATVLQFAVGDTLFSAEDEANGFYVIISGVVKVNYKPSFDVIEARESFGIIPNAEIFYDPTFENEMADFFTTGSVLGELSALVGASQASTATCETGVSVFHISQSTITLAIESFDDRYDSLEGRLWRTFGMKLAAAVLPLEPAFQSWTIEKIKTHLERSAVPIGDQYMTLAFPEFISDVVLIYGQVMNFDNSTQIFTAPCLIPRSVLKIAPIPGWEIKPRVLIIASRTVETDDEELHDEDIDSDEKKRSLSTADIHKYMATATKPGAINETQVEKINRPSLSVNFGVQKKSHGLFRHRSKSEEET